VPASTSSSGEKPLGLAPWSQWQRWCRDRSAPLLRRLQEVYGDQEARLEDRLATLCRLLSRHREQYGEATVGLVRAPGRLNTLSMHTDHRGSFINPMALEQEVLLSFSPGQDDRIDLGNLDPQYPQRSFHISQYRPPGELATTADWLHWTQVLTDERQARGTANDWMHKVAAVPVYLQQMLFRDRPLRGLSGIFTSSLPPRVGLSSSSALVVATMEAMLAVNDLQVRQTDYPVHCGVAEWYVGTRGGFGDQAAIKFGRRGYLIHMKTLPELDIRCYIPFPRGYEILVFNSGLEADKTGPAGSTFNERTATYEIGEIYLRRFIRRDRPQVFDRVSAARDHLPPDIKRFYLADIVEHFSHQDIYSWLAELPARRTRSELLTELPEEAELLGSLFSTHREPDAGYPVRAVMTYGLAECYRGKALEEVLSRTDIAAYGRLMCVSHDGDRVSNLTPELERLKEGPTDPSVPLELQPGSYTCSIPEIDEMVDIALRAGALGAQVSGAGLGGSVMALVAGDRARQVIEAMREHYFEPAGVEPNHLIARPSQGACLL